MAETPTLQIPKDVIEPIIQAHIAGAVTAALSGREQIVTDAVNRVLTMQVDDQGKPSSYGRSQTFVQWLMNDAIRTAAVAALREALEKEQPAIKKAIAAELKKQSSPIAKQMVESFSRLAASDHMLNYGVSINVSMRDR